MKKDLGPCVNSEVLYHFVIATQNVKIRFVNTLCPLRVVVSTLTHSNGLTGCGRGFRYKCFL